MSLFLNTLGGTNVGIGICDRCKMKRPLVRLVPDGNSPGLRVCEDKPGCRDVLDPWRLPARRTEDIAFFDDLRDEGFTIWCDPSIELGHVGEKEWRGRFADALKTKET